MDRPVSIVVAILVALGLLSLAWRAIPMPAQADQAVESPSVPLRPADSARGAAVFQTVGCVDCHSVRSVAQARGTLGPPLDGLATRAAGRRAGLSAEAYIRESIEQPSAYVVRGYFNVMPTDLRSRMTRQQFEDLVAWLMTLR